MKTETLTMPQLGESVTEGTISMWLVKPGDTVKKYDPIAEVITDKVTAEVPSSFDGVIEKLLAEEGDTLQVGDAIVTGDQRKSLRLNKKYRLSKRQRRLILR